MILIQVHAKESAAGSAVLIPKCDVYSPSLTSGTVNQVNLKMAEPHTSVFTYPESILDVCKDKHN
jgi:hypothetical protein